MDDYIDESNLLLLVVAVANQESSDLDWVNLGPPNLVPRLNVTPDEGLIPLESVLTGSTTICTLGEITKFEWDWEGDGTYDEDSGLDDTVEHTYNFAAEFNPVMRVTNSFGIQRTATLPVTTTYPWSTSWGKAGFEFFHAVAIYDNQYVYCAGGTQSYGAGHTDALLVKYDINGALLWARSWGGSAYDGIFDIDTVGDGSVVAVGNTRSFGEGDSDIIIQRWDPDGNLMWASCWGGSGADNGNAIDYTMDGLDEEIYVTGMSTGAGGGGADGVLLNFEPNGALDWAKFFGDGYGDDGGTLVLTRSLTSPLKVHIAGSYGTSPTSEKAALLTFTKGGTLDRAYTYDGFTEYLGCDDIIALGGLNVFEFWITGWVNNGVGGRQAFLLQYPTFGDATCMCYGEGPTDETYSTGLFTQGSGFVLGGYTGGIGSYLKAYLLSVNTSGEVVAGKYLGNGEANTSFNRVTKFLDAGALGVGIANASNDVTWSAYMPNFASTEGEWSLTTISSGSANGTLTSLAGMGDVTTISSATIDTGGGDADAFAVATPAP
jgi:hypothetical protein